MSRELLAKFPEYSFKAVLRPLNVGLYILDECYGENYIANKYQQAAS